MWWSCCVCGSVCVCQGNLVHRAVNLCAKYCGGVVPDLDLSQGWAPLAPPFDLAKLRDETEQSFAQLAIHVSAPPPFPCHHGMSNIIEGTRRL